MKEKLFNFKVILVILLLTIIYLLATLNHNTTMLYKAVRFLPTESDIDYSLNSIESELSDIESSVDILSDEIWKLE